MPWMRPPSWLYPPPHIYHGTDDGTQDSEAKRRRQQTAGPDDAEAIGGNAIAVEWPTLAAATQSARHDGIRGRGPTPGAQSSNAVQTDAIRGPVDGPGAHQQDGRLSGAQQKLALRNWHLRISLEHHAERVNNKRNRAQGGSGGPTATERLAALRRRIADRAEGRHADAEEDNAVRNDQGTAQAIGPPPSSS